MRKTSLLFLLVMIMGCANEATTPPEGEKSNKIQEIKATGKLTTADIIRNPVNADGPTDTVNVAKISLSEIIYDFGTVNEGDIVTHVFPFENTGKIPLLITDARSTCGCTVPNWPQEPIPPGGKNEIKVKFDTDKKTKNQTKTITIISNTYPSETKIKLVGFVNPSKDSD